MVEACLQPRCEQRSNYWRSDVKSGMAYELVGSMVEAVVGTLGSSRSDTDGSLAILYMDVQMRQGVTILLTVALAGTIGVISQRQPESMALPQSNQGEDNGEDAKDGANGYFAVVCGSCRRCRRCRAERSGWLCSLAEDGRHLGSE